MKFFKKAKEMFARMTGSSVRVSDAPPPVRPDPTPEPSILPEFLKPIPKYQREQRDFERRAKATTVRWNSSPVTAGGQGTRVAGRNAAKRSKRARLEPKFGRRWKKHGVGAMDLAVSA